MDSLIESRMGADAAIGVEWTQLARLPSTTVDEMNRVEAAVTLHLCCEPGRCAWLRSQPFLRLRMTALYFPRLCETQPITLFHQGLRVTLLDGHVAISRQDPAYDSFLATLAEIAVEDQALLPRRGPKRARPPC
jgi:hypothetical protein